MTKSPSLFLKIACACAGIAVATSSIMFGSPASAETTSTLPDTSSQFPSSPQSPTITLLDFRQVAKRAIPAVVSITVKTNKRTSALGDDSAGEDPFDLFGSDLWRFFGLPRQGEGIRSQPLVGQASGVIVSLDGLILTNNHVVHNMDSIDVKLNDGREFKAKVLGEDPDIDLALIKIDAQNLPYLKLGNSDDLEVGQWVAAIGNPFELQGSLTVGVVSAKRRNNLSITRYGDFIQTDASINRGNSGGALVTPDGDVIGINTAIATNASAGYMGIGFAIPSSMARHFIDEILSDGKISRGFLGIQLQPIDSNLAQAFNLDKIQGALVTNVVKSSAADQAGIKPEDVILEYNGHPIENAASLRNTVYMMKPGTKLVFTILRGDKKIQVPLIVGDLSKEEKAIIAQPESKENQLGIEVSNLTPEIAQSLGYTEDKGVVVAKVNPNSAAAWTGLKKGALILGVNRKQVTDIDQFNQALRDAPKDRPLLLQIKQGDRHLFLSLKID